MRSEEGEFLEVGLGADVLVSAVGAVLVVVAQPPVRDLLAIGAGVAVLLVGEVGAVQVVVAPLVVLQWGAVVAERQACKASVW